MSQKVIIKPAEFKKQLKERVKFINKKLPHNWCMLFIHDNPEYKGQSAFLYSVVAGRSLHEETISVIENWVNSLDK